MLEDSGKEAGGNAIKRTEMAEQMERRRSVGWKKREEENSGKEIPRISESIFHARTRVRTCTCVRYFKRDSHGVIRRRLRWWLWCYIVNYRSRSIYGRELAESINTRRVVRGNRWNVFSVVTWKVTKFVCDYIHVTRKSARRDLDEKFTTRKINVVASHYSRRTINLPYFASLSFSIQDHVIINVACFVTTSIKTLSRILSHIYFALTYL